MRRVCASLMSDEKARSKMLRAFFDFILISNILFVLSLVGIPVVVYSLYIVVVVKKV